ncbi:DUF4252 domain-containing protein [Labilibaculum sp.]|uniref:DUF4252 domain-containing protein n=1 Tax=Labilibaculum sp. TaxID=2060723 RepID=UPI003564382E
MKKILITLAVIALPIFLMAQTKGEKIHAKYSNLEGFSSFNFAGSFLKNLDFDVDEDELEKNITGDCESIQFLSYKHETGKETKFKKIVISELSKGNLYSEVLEGKDSDNTDEVRFFAKGKGDQFKEFHILHYNENRTSLVSFYGDFKTKELSSLSHFTFDKDENEDQ